jgi:hypothetical protein
MIARTVAQSNTWRANAMISGQWPVARRVQMLADYQDSDAGIRR